ncbi:MAG: primosomal protein N' [Chloroflexota bacterium]|nr:primosomal protein N' [Chloroflexota bacterium]
MAYAEVAVNSPVKEQHTFTYEIPQGITVCPGHAVLVPFGFRTLQGIVFQLDPSSKVQSTREIIEVLGDAPLLSPYQLALARWISEYYIASLFDSAILMLPPGFERKSATLLRCVSELPQDLGDVLSADEKDLFLLIQQKQGLLLQDAENVLGKKRMKGAVTGLIQRGLIKRSQQLERDRIGIKVVRELVLSVPRDQAMRESDALVRRAPKQAELLRLLAEQPDARTIDKIKDRMPGVETAARGLQNKGLISINPVTVFRNPLEHVTLNPSSPPTLTCAQRKAVEEISFAIGQLNTADCSALKMTQDRIFLLHGITGSGKTEVYLHILAQTIARGKRGIVLVPEIALTPQTVERFASRFPGRVAVWHSKLAMGERFDQWRQIAEGAFDVVVGSRSAIFAPQPGLGLIVLDEEQEWTYKQQEQPPRYHVKEVAIKLAELTGAVVVLGSATPSVESFYSACNGDYRLLQIPERISMQGQPALPQVEVIDLREELRSGNRSIFSRTLRNVIGQTLDAGEQAILFLNRRGSSTFVQCRECGFVLRCNRCDLPYTYHSSDDTLVCHQCNRRQRIASICPNCQGSRIRFLGIGTQKVVEETAKLFPSARILRWDRDVIRNKRSHESIVKRFTNREADILIGTQMIAKGLDIPSITLVGVILADTVLHFPDFRASERTYQLLTQVAGRAGRGLLSGRVVIQTYSPDHYAIDAAAHHDYRGFYDKEVSHRCHLLQPPFSQLVRLIYEHSNADSCRIEATRMAKQIRDQINSWGLPELTLIGPTPAFFAKARGRYRWHIILRGKNPTSALADVALPRGWTVDVDPINIL